MCHKQGSRNRGTVKGGLIGFDDNDNHLTMQCNTKTPHTPLNLDVIETPYQMSQESGLRDASRR
ncbi:MAG: hypothetical protein ABSE82_17110 [Nitrososphaerales archaeon]